MDKDKIEGLDREMGQETASLGEIGHDLEGGKASPTPKAKCVCCGMLKAKPGFKYCFGCHKKWHKVYDCYLAAGFSEEISKKRATKAYPPRYD